MSPTRIQRRRTKGWRAPAGAKYVGRGTRWGNPWVVAQTGRRTWAVNWAGASARPEPDWTVDASTVDAAHVLAVGLYREYLGLNPKLARRAVDELAGVDLMCWCAPEMACHADVLLELANPAAPLADLAAVVVARADGIMPGPRRDAAGEAR